MPDGYDASTVAAEAVTEFLRDIQSQTDSLAPSSTYDQELHHRCNLWSAPSSFSPLPSVQMSPSGDGQGEGFHVSPTHHQTLNPDLSELTFQQLQQELRQRVCRIVNRLRHRKENLLLRNDADLAPVIIDDGESIGVLEAIPSSEPGPPEILIQKEEAGELDQTKERFNRFLGADQLLKDLFACLCDGTSKRAAIARKLRLSASAVKNCQKRLARRLDEFNRQRSQSK